MAADEIIIEVDKDDNVIGARPAREFFKTDRIHRASHLLVFNSKGELLLQLRAKDKKIYPGVWDTSVGGTVPEAESYEQCLERETKEELGITTRFKHLFHRHCFDDIDKSHKEVYAALHDGPFNIDKGELSDVRWVSLAALKAELESNPEHFTPTLVEIMKVYFSKYGEEPVT
jgi:isopentenyldiphosphate isomerase